MARRQIVLGPTLRIQNCPKLSDPERQVKMLDGRLYLTGRGFKPLHDCLNCSDYQGDDGLQVDCGREA